MLTPTMVNPHPSTKPSRTFGVMWESAPFHDKIPEVGAQAP